MSADPVIIVLDAIYAGVNAAIFPLVALKDKVSPPTSRALGERLDSAISWNSRLYARHLLKLGADPNRKDNDGFHLLFRTALNDQSALGKLLIKAGAKIDTGNDVIGATPLMGAARAGNTRFVRMLLNSGADVSKADGNGKTALDFVREKGYADIIALLEPLTATAVATPSLAGSSAGIFNAVAPANPVATTQPVAVSRPLTLKSKTP